MGCVRVQCREHKSLILLFRSLKTHLVTQSSNIRMGPFAHVRECCTTAFQVEDGPGEEVKLVAWVLYNYDSPHFPIMQAIFDK